jgi:arsenite methyltransferase
MSEESTNKSYSCCGSKPTADKNENQGNNQVIDSVDVRQKIRNQYGAIASGKPDPTSNEGKNLKDSENSGYTNYSNSDLESIPQGAELGLGTGNPVALAQIQEGETIVDLGSGAGVDCFLASKQTGATGKVIGVDMTPEMLDRARRNKTKGDYSNVEFRLGEIEHLPIADNSVDLIISNCVINLSLDKSQVFKDAYRVLKPGGRILISDIVLEENFPDAVKKELDKTPGCVSRASTKVDYVEVIERAGFEKVEIIEKNIITPRVQSKMHKGDVVKRKIIVSGKEIDVDLTSEEDEKLETLVQKAHIRGFKPI